MIDLKLPLLATAALAVTPGILMASSHMDAPLITLDDAANTTDVYAFVTTGANGEKYLTTALSVYPFEEPGIGPNKYNFDDNVLYGLHVSTGNDLPLGRPTFSYWFEFDTTYKNDATILQSYTGVVQNVDDGAQNLTQRYSVRAFDHRWNQGWGLRNLGTGVVPPNNQGKATPEYNLQAGDGPAKDGVGSSAMLDRYTTQSIKSLDHGYVAFAGQREDGFYGDINAIFDLLSLRGLVSSRPLRGARSRSTVATVTRLKSAIGSKLVARAIRCSVKASSPSATKTNTTGRARVTTLLCSRSMRVLPNSRHC